MRYVECTPEQFARGKKLARKALAHARKQPLDPHAHRIVRSPLAAAMDNHVRVKNIRSIVFRKLAEECWVFDIFFKNVPQHLPNTLSTHPMDAFRSKRAAWAGACQAVTDIYQIEIAGKQTQVALANPGWSIGEDMILDGS